jgi:general stress protein CsbA
MKNIIKNRIFFIVAIAVVELIAGYRVASILSTRWETGDSL